MYKYIYIYIYTFQNDETPSHTFSLPPASFTNQPERKPSPFRYPSKGSFILSSLTTKKSLRTWFPRPYPPLNLLTNVIRIYVEYSNITLWKYTPISQAWKKRVEEKLHHRGRAPADAARWYQWNYRPNYATKHFYIYIFFSFLAPFTSHHPSPHSYILLCILPPSASTFHAPDFAPLCMNFLPPIFSELSGISHTLSLALFFCLHRNAINW